MSSTFAVVGPGKAGRAIANELQAVGLRLVGVLGRNRAHSTAAAQGLTSQAGLKLLTSWADIVSAADAVVVATPDSALIRVAKELASQTPKYDTGDESDMPIVLHVSGAVSSDVLAPLRRVGCRVGSLHPMQSLADPLASLRGIAWGIEGDQEAVSWARRVVELLEGTALEIQTEAKPIYHAAACVASNYLAVLIELAAELLEQAEIPRPQGVAALLPLIRGSLENVRRLGLPAALTGPIERGDVQTVASHLDAFEAYDIRPDLVTIYQALGAEAVRLAARKGSVDPAAAAQIGKLLQSGEEAASGVL